MACDTCLFWQKDEHPDASAWIGDEDAKLAEDEGDTWGICNRERRPGSKMFTQDASQYFSSLHTRSSFSCAQFEEGEYVKQPQDPELDW